MADEVYLDHAATTPVHPEAAELACKVMTERYGNPSSLHRKGLEAEGIVKESRRTLAEALEAEPGEIVFTSGGTEGNNLALKGAARARSGRGRHIVTSAIEHPSVLRALADLEEEGFSVTRVAVDKEGIVDPERVAEAVTEKTILVSVMQVNNEVGSIQPIAEIAAQVKRIRPDLLVHVDGVQGFGKIRLSPGQAGVDLYTLSGHKFGAPKGVGALYVRKGVQLRPLFGGGEQERGLRSGTENVPGIAALALAARLALSGREEAHRRMQELRSLLIDELLAIEGAEVNGPRAPERAAPHIVSFSFRGVRGEVLVHALEARGVYVSTGSACSSRRATKSHVLTALDLDDEAVEGSIRVSLSPASRREDVVRAASAFRSALAELRR